MSLGKIADDILGIDPSGEGIFGSFRDNPELGALASIGLSFVPGVGPVLANTIPQALTAMAAPKAPAGMLSGPAPSMGGGLLGGPMDTSAFDYARSIAGGMPFSQVVQPGMSFSPTQPMGQQLTPQAPMPAPKPMIPMRPAPEITPLPTTPPKPSIPIEDIERIRALIGPVGIA
tara:strand:+ start:692 stop:1213 length:522 start_codon:yes stop_codon:yes gene_type:complete